MKAWYLDHDKDGRVFFKNTKNMIAEMHSLVDSYSNEQAKKELKKFLKEKFEPSIKDCYQELQVFPAIDEINLSVDKVALIIFEPHSGTGLHPELSKFYESTSYKNRVMFLSGQRDTMNRLYTAAKELKAIETIIANMRDERVSESNQQYQIAMDTKTKKVMAVLECARQTFVTLYFPNKKGMTSADFLMQFKENKYNGEEQIRLVLEEKMKFSEDVSGESFIKKCEDRLFTRQEMMWNEIKERAATNTGWQWHHPKALEIIKDECTKKDMWREHGGCIKRGPFEKDPTDVKVQKLRSNDHTGEVTLKIIPVYGDKVYYEVGAIATTASLEVVDFNNFKTKEIEISFICVDSTGDHPIGEVVTWKDDVKVRYKLRDISNGKMLKLESHPNVTIKYTTDGSNPKENGGVYYDEVEIPENTTFIQVVAEYNGYYFDVETIKIDKKEKSGVSIDNVKPLKLHRGINCNDTNTTYSDIKLLKKYNAKIKDITLQILKEGGEGWIDLSIDSSTVVDLENLEKTIDTLKTSFMNDNRTNITLEYNTTEFNKGEEFLDWVNEKGLSLSEFNESEIMQ